MIAAAVVDWGGVAAIGGLLIAILGGLAKIIVIAARIEAQVTRHRVEIERNARHLDSVMATLWPTIWRVSSLEDWAAVHHGYTPPRLFPTMPGGDDDGAG